MVWACDEKRGKLLRKEGGGNESTGTRKRGRPKRRWLKRVKYDIPTVGGGSVRPCYMEVYMSSYSIDPT